MIDKTKICSFKIFRYDAKSPFHFNTEEGTLAVLGLHALPAVVGLKVAQKLIAYCANKNSLARTIVRMNYSEKLVSSTTIVYVGRHSWLVMHIANSRKRKLRAFCP